MPEKISTNNNIPPEIFFMNLSHEIRTPLNSINASVQLLEKHTDKNKANKESNCSIDKYLAIIKKNNYRLYKVLDNLIYYLKINNDLHHYSPENHDIIPLIQNTTESCKKYVIKQDKTISFKTTLRKKIIACDSFYIKKIIFNLISNALKFTKKGDQILVNVYEEKSKLCVSVKDTGIGIPEEKQKFIFSTFYKIEESLCRNNEGSGMGLPLVKEMINLHEGNIELISKKGKGTEFIVKLPDKAITNSSTKSYNHKQLSIQPDMLNMVEVELSDINI